jgi:hypothetical protein
VWKAFGVGYAVPTLPAAKKTPRAGEEQAHENGRSPLAQPFPTPDISIDLRLREVFGMIHTGIFAGV